MRQPDFSKKGKHELACFHNKVNTRSKTPIRQQLQKFVGFKIVVKKLKKSNCCLMGVFDLV